MQWHRVQGHGAVSSLDWPQNTLNISWSLPAILQYIWTSASSCYLHFPSITISLHLAQIHIINTYDDQANFTNLQASLLMTMICRTTSEKEFRILQQFTRKKLINYDPMLSAHLVWSTLVASRGSGTKPVSLEPDHCRPEGNPGMRLFAAAQSLPSASPWRREWEEGWGSHRRMGHAAAGWGHAARLSPFFAGAVAEVPALLHHAR
jgi:hypothetical protein